MKFSLKKFIKELKERHALVQQISKNETELYMIKRELKKQEKEEKAKNKTSKK